MKSVVLILLIMIGFASANGIGNNDKESLAGVPNRCPLNGNMATENFTVTDGPIVNLVESPIEFLANYYSQVKYNWQSRRNVQNLSAAVGECQCEDDLMPIDVCYVSLGPAKGLNDSIAAQFFDVAAILQMDGDGLATCQVSSLQLNGVYHMLCYLYVAAGGVVFYYLWVLWVAKPRGHQQPVSEGLEGSSLTESSGDESRFIVNYHDPVSRVEDVVDKHCLKAPMDQGRNNAGQRRVPHYTFYPTYVVYEQYADQPNLVDYDDFILDDNYPLYIITYL